MIWILLLFYTEQLLLMDWTRINLSDLSLYITSNHLIFHQIFFLMEILYISKYHLIMKSFWILPRGNKGYLNRDDAMS